MPQPSRLPLEPPTFTAIDFETATRSPDSACAVGLVRVERGVIVRRAACLIRPPSREFEFTYVHGLTWDDVAEAPSFAGVWPVIRELFAGVDFVSAHNASFDEGVLRACCLRAHLPMPWARRRSRAGPRARPRFECTVELARRAWGIYPTRLDVVAARLGVHLRHHDAASDAEACAEIVLRAHAAGTRVAA